MKNLIKSIDRSNFPHSVMLISRDQDSLSNFSKELAKVLMCEEKNAPCNKCVQCQKIEHNNHADVMIFPQEKKTIATEEMLRIVDSVLTLPYESDKKVYILNHTSSINEQAQNKLLKTLEEPGRNVYFILNVSNEAKVLSTIKSRCRKIYLPRVEQSAIAESLKDFNLSPSTLEDIISLSEGSLEQARAFAKNPNFENLLGFVFDLWLNMRHSSQVLRYASKLYLAKGYFDDFINLYLSIMQEVIYVKLGQLKLIKNNSRIAEYQKIAADFSLDALAAIATNCMKIKEKIERNCNFNLLIDNFLISILEERIKWQ